MATPTPTPQPPLTPDQRLALEERDRYQRFARNAAIAGVIICPTIALMPPRKLDLYTFSLAIGFYLSADHLATHYTGRGIVANIPMPSTPNALPTEKARELRKEREELERGRESLREGGAGFEGREAPKGLLSKVWMGDEKEGWKERRLEEERRKLAEGQSYTSMILEQVWEVWNWDKKKGGDQTNDGEVEGKKD